MVISGAKPHRDRPAERTYQEWIENGSKIEAKLYTVAFSPKIHPRDGLMVSVTDSHL